MHTHYDIYVLYFRISNKTSIVYVRLNLNVLLGMYLNVNESSSDGQKILCSSGLRGAYQRNSG